MTSTASDTPNASATSTITTTTIKDYAPRSMVSIVSDVSSQDASWETNFDAELTKNVNELLKSLEEFLYQETRKACLQSNECAEWSYVFPHFRQVEVIY